MEGFTLPYLWKLLYYEKTPYFEHTHTHFKIILFIFWFSTQQIKRDLNGSGGG